MAGAFGQGSTSFGTSNVFGTSNSSNPFASNTTGTATFPGLSPQGSVFGGTGSATNVFGAPSTSPFPQPNQGSRFGTSGNNVFDAPSTSPFPLSNQGSKFGTSKTNVFGAPSTSPFPLSNQGLVFGSCASATNVFGAPSSSSNFASGQGSGSNISTANPFTSNTFGNGSNSSHNPFASNTFESTTSPSFPSQGSFFCGSSTGVFGAPPASSPSFTFGKPPAFFGLLSTSGTTSIGSLGAFGSTTSKGAFVVSPSSFGTGSQGAFGSTTSKGAFGEVSSLIFGTTSTGSQGAFGSTTSKGAFGELPSTFGTTSIGSHGAFGSTTSKGAFGELPSSFGTTSVGSHGGFGSTTSKGAFGELPSTFGTTSIGSHGTFGSTTSKGSFGELPSTFGTTSIGSHGAFGPTTSKGAFGGLSLFGTSTIGSHGSLGSTTLKGAFGSNTGTNAGASTCGPFNFASNRTTPPSNSVTGINNPFQTNSQPVLMQNSVGSRIKPYAKSNVMEGSDSRKFISISAMPFYERKSHEELRWEDYELKSGGQSNSVNDQASGINKGQFVYPLPSVTSSLPTTVLGHDQITANNSAFLPTKSWPNHENSEINTNSVNDQAVGINKEQLAFPLPSVTSYWQTNVFGRDQVSANNSAFQPTKSWPHNENLEINMNQAPSTWTAPHVSTGNKGGASLDVGLPQPSLSHQFPGTGKVMESIIAVKDPFGSEPATSRPFLCHFATSSLVQHEISNMPVSSKPERTRVSSYFTSRHRSLKPLAVNVRKYHPSSDGPKVPFFDRVEEIHFTSMAYSYIIPRENPRSVFAASTELTHVSTSKEVASPLYHASAVKYEDGCDIAKKDQINSSMPNPCKDHFAEMDDNAKEVNELLLPKLQRSEYYTEPKIEKLASIESLNPGFCFHVKDFVVGRDGYGWVKFYGETNVRGLNLDSIIQFNYREVIVYADASEKPPVGQGLNKAAEVTLLNIRCIDRSGKQYTSGKMVDKYIEKLKKVAEKQGAEFVSYDPVKEEWKFSVEHF